MASVLATLNSTMAELQREIDMHQRIVREARAYVESTSANLGEAREALNALAAAEKEKREEHGEFLRFLNNEPNRGTPIMRAKLDSLNAELAALVMGLGAARDKVSEAQRKHEGAKGALQFNESRLVERQSECAALASRIRELATVQN